MVLAGELPTETWQVDALNVEPPLDAPWQPAGAWEEAFAKDAAEAKSELRLTRAMSCLARELGRFYLEHHAAPAEALYEFQSAACGNTVPEIGFQWVGGEAPDRVSESRLLAEWRALLKPDLLDHLPANATEAGFWFGRAHGRVVAVLSHAAPRVRWKTLSLLPDADGNVTLEGELDQAAEVIVGYANRGRLGVATCAIDPGIARPRFRAICPIGRDDSSAWVQLLYAPLHRAMLRPFAQLLVRRTVSQPLAFERLALGAPRIVASAEAFSRAVVELLNGVRRQAGFESVRLSPAESLTATRLAPAFFADAMAPGGDGSQMDSIALGLLAGWNVGGMIRDGLFVSMTIPRTNDAQEWLGLALAMPLGRATLLAEEIDEVALGPVLVPQAGGLAAIVTGYRHYQEGPHDDDVARLYARLEVARKRLGLGRPFRLARMAHFLREEMQRVHEGRTPPALALEAALHHSASQFRSEMRGYVIETTSVDTLQIPEEIIRRPNLYMEIGVAHHKPPGAAWGQLVIVVIFADAPPVNDQAI